MYLHASSLDECFAIAGLQGCKVSGHALVFVADALDAALECIAYLAPPLLRPSCERVISAHLRA